MNQQISLFDNDHGVTWDAMTPLQRFAMLDKWVGEGQTDMGDRYKDRKWISFNIGEQNTLSSVIEKHLSLAQDRQATQPSAESKLIQEQQAELQLDKKIGDAVDQYASTGLVSLAELSAASLEIEKSKLRAWLSDEYIARRIPTEDVLNSLYSKVNAITSNIKAAPQVTLAAHKDVMDRALEGTIGAAEFKTAFDALLLNKDGIVAELEAMTKPEIFKRFPGLEFRYKSEKKADGINAAYRDMVSDFTLGEAYSYGMSSGSMIDSIRAIVEKTTDKTLSDFADGIKQRREESEARKQEALAGMDNPQTLEDYQRILKARASEIGEGATFGQARMAMPLEQRIKFDELAAEFNRGERAKRKVTQQEQSLRAPGEAVETTEIVKTRHTKHGHDLWQFQMVQRVAPEEFKSLALQAKRLGGDYSSYRGNEAIPGWQFRTEEAANAFKALVAGDTEQAKDVMDARRDAFADDRSQTVVERLTEMAGKLDERADASLNQERKENTTRRADMAARAETAARSDKALAQTMHNIAQAIQGDSAKFLDRIRQKVQVETLRGFAHTAQADMLRQKYPTYAEQEKHRDDPITAEAADYVTFPNYTVFRSDLANIGRALLEVDGSKKLGQQIMKVADDVSDAYLTFAKENLHKVSTFSKTGGGGAVFASKAEAEAVIARSGFNGQAIVLPFKRGQNIIIQSPSEALKRGIWQGDNDKRITLHPEIGAELVEKMGKTARKTNKFMPVPWQLENAYDSRKRLAGMNIETPAELRAALREFIGLREAPQVADKIKQMERAMIGRRNDGLDFFPTPENAADEAIAAADIKQGMSVYEPHAGMGHIADRIRESGIEPDVGEIASERRALLEAKGYNLISSDFLDMRIEDTPGGLGYDRIIMNPPFSNRRDVIHTQHGYTLLKPEGRIVSIISEGAFFGSDLKAQSFRDWIEPLGGSNEKLESGTFLDPSLPVNTGVSARMVVIDKRELEIEKCEIKDGLYSGRIMDITHEHVVQKIGRNLDSLIRHDIKIFSKVPGKGEVVDIVYKNGIGKSMSNCVAREF